MKKRIIPLVPKEERQQLNEGVNKPEAPDLTKSKLHACNS
jgi:hypothetical protein